jgi:hypothetical protein
MQFRLHYRGPLHANADAARKQAIRRVIHPQLKTLWDSPSLAMWKEKDWVFPGGEERWMRPRGNFRFIPLVNHKLENVASLQVTWLRPGPLGSLVNATGDIDNRLKTLFDALRVPTEAPANDQPGMGENPFFCLLDDDALITEAAVTTDRLLEPNVADMHVEMIVAVSLRLGAASLPQAVYFQI